MTTTNEQMDIQIEQQELQPEQESWHDFFIGPRMSRCTGSFEGCTSEEQVIYVGPHYGGDLMAEDRGFTQDTVDRMRSGTWREVIKFSEELGLRVFHVHRNFLLYVPAFVNNRFFRGI